MAQRPRIIRLEAPSATQNAINNLTEDIFMPFGGSDFTFAQTLAPQTPAASTPTPLAPPKAPTASTASTASTAANVSTASTVSSAKNTPKKGNFFTKLFGTKEERQANRARRRKNRAERKAARKLRKSARQLRVEMAAKERALKLGKSQAEAQAAANLAGAQVKAGEEKSITLAEERAKTAALNQGLTQQQAEDAANAAGGLIEDRIFGGGEGYGTDVKKDETFWGSMSTGAKVGLIGGGVVVLGLITWGIIAANKNK